MIDTTVFQDKTAVYYTLGCKLNFSETSTIGKILREAGVRTARKGEKADICVVNTCSVTEMADKKCRQAIHRLVKQHPGAFVVVTGCYAQLKPGDVAKIDGVDVVLGAEQKGELLQYLGNLQKHEKGEAITTATKDIRSFSPSCSRGDRTRFFLKVQDGCDYFCSYCTIPFARGRSRNGTIASMVEQARQAAAEGGKEIVLTGVNIGDFGKTTGETFFDLVQTLDQIEGIERYRISSIEPNLLTDEIIEFVSHSRSFMPHFHIPLQSGCDEVLKLMRRRYDTALFASKVKKIKEVMPDAFIGVDVIRLGSQYLRGYIFDCIFAGIHFSCSGYFCACGKSGLSFLHNILAIVLVRIPGVYLTSRLFKTTLFPMGLATAAGSLLSVFICVIAFYVIYHKERRNHKD